MFHIFFVLLVLWRLPNINDTQTLYALLNVIWIIVGECLQNFGSGEIACGQNRDFFWNNKQKSVFIHINHEVMFQSISLPSLASSLTMQHSVSIISNWQQILTGKHDPKQKSLCLYFFFFTVENCWPSWCGWPQYSVQYHAVKCNEL